MELGRVAPVQEDPKKMNIGGSGCGTCVTSRSALRKLCILAAVSPDLKLNPRANTCQELHTRRPFNKTGEEWSGAISVIGRVNVFPVLISRTPTSLRSLIARSVG